MDVSGATVTISLERLKELEMHEQKRMGFFERMKKRDEEHPEEASKRSLKYYYKNQEAVKAKRRERYKLKKEAEAAAKAAQAPA